MAQQAVEPILPPHKPDKATALALRTPSRGYKRDPSGGDLHAVGFVATEEAEDDVPRILVLGGLDRLGGDVHLYELAFGCRIYGGLTGYDSSLVRLRKATGDEIDPYEPLHRRALFKWLNDWGCRQFSTAHHETVASPSLVGWADIWTRRLPPAGMQVDQLDDDEIVELGRAYGDLQARLAGTRTQRTGSISDVRYGPTGAAKTMFALRPNLCPPWDAFTLAKLGFGHSAGSYSAYLRRVISDLRGVAREARVSIAELAPLVGRPGSTPPKLIDEYYWVTITRGFVPPTRDELATWLGWADIPDLQGSGT